MKTQPQFGLLYSAGLGFWFECQCREDGRRYKHPAPRYKPGEVVYCKETWSLLDQNSVLFDGSIKGWKSLPDGWTVIYRTCQEAIYGVFAVKWHPSLLMPEWAARAKIRILSVTPQRLQSITEVDAKAEGIRAYTYEMWDGTTEIGYETERLARGAMCSTAADAFRRRWDSLNAKQGFPWDANPWLFKYEFEVTK